MEFITVNSALVVLMVVLVFLAFYCYDLGRSANEIHPGTGDSMTSLGASAGFLMILTAVNFTVLFTSKKLGKKKVKISGTGKKKGKKAGKKK